MADGEGGSGPAFQAERRTVFGRDEAPMTGLNVLLASHGTPGAEAAEQAALARAKGGGRVRHVVVVPDFWKGMLGDDWLNNAVVHVRFGRYVENQIEREMLEHLERTAAAAEAAGVPYAAEARQGDPAECLLAAAAEGGIDLVVVGSSRPKGAPGFRSRMNLDRLARSLKVPLLVVPHPGR